MVRHPDSERRERSRRDDWAQIRRRIQIAPLHYDLGYFDPEQKTLQPLDNPFGTRLSPMS
ncbi:hypothetical protein BST63_01620 [Bradyrhizobium canariense]|uniref:Uncharacterized protein n=1 Tax=Bradyrhizobium canariense TaxID=255045 RepID=A0ABX3XB70_9BRAD|nr:hypothetical protein BSR47_01680 [Bradyrhizobium canariense]OSJ35664.1 hypothetical protein BST63_01620 [Bradyrhizobium canariense]